MKKPKLELQLTDLLVSDINSPTLDALKMAVLARPRRQVLTKSGKIMKGFGYSPNLDSWRDVVRRYLRRMLPGFAIYVGGHHVALHAPAKPGKGAFGRTPSREFGPCLARIMEVTPI